MLQNFLGFLTLLQDQQGTDASLEADDSEKLEAKTLKAKKQNFITKVQEAA